MAPIISVNHQCPSGYDIRPLQYALGNSLHRQSHAHAQSVLSSFSFSKFAAKVFPPASIDIGIGGRELSKLHDVVSLRANHSTSIRAEDRERLAVSEFTIWLTSRAAEIKSGGLLACHFAIRTYPLSDERTRSGDRAPSASPAVHSMSLPTSPRGSLDGAAHLSPKPRLLSPRRRCPVRPSPITKAVVSAQISGEPCTMLSVRPYSVWSPSGRSARMSRPC